MKDFKDKVAVITGGANGIGRAIAERCVHEGMKVVLADIEERPLIQTVEEIKATGASVIGVLTDVSKQTDVDALAQKALEAFGAVHLLFNNAGVSGWVTSTWKSTLAHWEWVMSVNLWGVIHGIRAFIPIMLEQDCDAHIVNTASTGALIHGPGGVYGVSKHAVLGLSETLYRELAQAGAKIDISVFCPGFVSTTIMDSDRNRPLSLQNDPDAEKERSEHMGRQAGIRRAVEAGISPVQAAHMVFNGIREKKFYILTHPEIKPLIKKRMEDILNEHNPSDLQPLS